MADLDEHLIRAAQHGDAAALTTLVADSGSPAYDLVKNFKWTNEDQNAVARMIAVDKLTPDQAAEKWVKANESKVNTWLGK